MAERIHKYFLPFIFSLVLISVMPIIVVRPLTPAYPVRTFLKSFITTSIMTAGLLALVIFLVGMTMFYLSSSSRRLWIDNKW